MLDAFVQLPDAAVQMMSGINAGVGPSVPPQWSKYQPERADISTAGGAARLCAISTARSPALSATPFPNSSSAVTGKASGWPVRQRGGSAGFSLLENSALSFARMHSQPTGCATIFLSDRFELDLENSGNPLVPHLGSLMPCDARLAANDRPFSGKFTEAIKRRNDGYRL